MKVETSFGVPRVLTGYEFIEEYKGRRIYRCNKCATYFLAPDGFLESSLECPLCRHERKFSDMSRRFKLGEHQKHGKLRRIGAIWFDTTSGFQDVKCLCRCDCGTIVSRGYTSVQQGYSLSCGCLTASNGKYDYVSKEQELSLHYKLNDLVGCDRVALKELHYFIDKDKAMRRCTVKDDGMLEFTEKVQRDFDQSEANVFRGILFNSEVAETSNTGIALKYNDDGAFESVSMSEDVYSWLKSYGRISHITNSNLVDVLLKFGEYVKSSPLYDLALSCVLRKEDKLQIATLATDNAPFIFGLVEVTRSGKKFHAFNASNKIAHLNGCVNSNFIQDYLKNLISKGVYRGDAISTSKVLGLEFRKVITEASLLKEVTADNLVSVIDFLSETQFPFVKKFGFTQYVADGIGTSFPSYVCMIPDSTEIASLICSRPIGESLVIGVGASDIKAAPELDVLDLVAKFVK